MDETAIALIECVEIESRTGHRFLNAPGAREPADEGGLAGPEVAMEGQHLIFGHTGGEGAGDLFGRLCGAGADARLQL